ncbi:MAG: hypothetical protein V4649_19110 [Bacteroidota bacterium]
MKKTLTLIAACIFGCATLSIAQSEVKTTAKKAAHATKRGVKKAGNKTAELAVKAEAKVADEEVKGKMGPNGETIYIKDGNKYYWVDSKGRKKYIPEASLRNR